MVRDSHLYTALAIELQFADVEQALFSFPIRDFRTGAA